MAGGKGTRLRSVTGSLPKVLVEVGGRAVLDRKLEQLAAAGVSRVHLLIGFEADQIERHLAEFPPAVEVVIHRDGPVLRGTGGAVVACLPDLPAKFVVTYADSLLDEPLGPIWDRYLEGAYPAILAITDQLDSEQRGNVAVVGDRVRRYSKDEDDATLIWLDYGYLAVSRDLLSPYVDSSPLDLGTVVADLASDRKLGAYPVSGKFWEVGTPESLREVNGHFSP